MKKHIKLSDDYYLVSQEVATNTVVDVVKKTNHVFIVDVSGSMYYDLPLIRKQLKNKLSNLMNEGDTITIIWFSGNGESGILKEEVEVKSLKTLTDFHNAIDKWLVPVGLTAFLKPLELTKEVIERIKINRPDSVFSLIFLTDGYNNDCPWNEVIKTLKGLENDLAASTFVEYGYYADTKKLTEMASLVGGEKISTGDFDEFEPVFETKISSGLKSSKKISVTIKDRYLYDFAFTVNDDGSVLLYNIPKDGSVLVPENTNELYFFSDKEIGEVNQDKIPEKEQSLYAAIYLLSDKLMNFEAEKVFYALGDNYYYRQLMNAYGKQKLNAFKNAIKSCVVDQSKRFPEGVSKIQPVSDDAYCLMNLFEDLAETPDVLFYPNHPDFKYNRIGRKKIARGSELSEEDKRRLSEARNIVEATEILNELKDKNIDIKFEASEPNRGYPISDLVWNSERANLSVRVKIDGKVILPDNKFDLKEVATYKYNTFTIIKDGILNIDKLPISCQKKTEDLLNNNGISYELSDNYDAKINKNTYAQTATIDLSSLPIINRKMVKSISAIDLAEQEWELVKLQAENKVYKFYKNELFPKKSEKFAELVGEEAAEWLKEIGITDYNGFAPKTDFEESADSYMSVNLKTKIKGLSSLPKVEAVLDKIRQNKPLKISEWVMSGPIKNYLHQLDSEMYKSLDKDKQEEVLKKYLTKKTDELNVNKRKAMQKVAEIKFALILSKRWFCEFKSFDDNKLDLELDGQKLNFTFDLSEKEVKI